MTANEIKRAVKLAAKEGRRDKLLEGLREEKDARKEEDASIRRYVGWN